MILTAAAPRSATSTPKTQRFAIRIPLRPAWMRSRLLSVPLLVNLPPDFVFTSAGHAVGHNGVGRLFWRAGGPDGPVGITGIDFVHVEGGRIKMLYVFLDSAPG
jgi:hypothetical protein